ncbi:GNAT family N-acetyltransferase [Nocardioides sp. C4-1]|uniref:GNAT family N-acetyltransferase n=1 Tax=Nocardioides sp. C4-1 TaxID=3151851 RepID=UPI003267B418
MELSTGAGDPDLDQRLSDELDAFNASATGDLDVAPQQELTVRADDADGLAGGVSGWTWGTAAGIAMTWVRADHRGTGLGARLMTQFEEEARRRGCTHAFVTSFTFQAPAFYERLGYREILRWDAVPDVGHDDVHLRKDL